MSDLRWHEETMRLINELTPDITGKAFDPGWFLLRQRFEEAERQMDALTASAEREAALREENARQRRVITEQEAAIGTAERRALDAELTMERLTEELAEAQQENQRRAEKDARLESILGEFGMIASGMAIKIPSVPVVAAIQNELNDQANALAAERRKVTALREKLRQTIRDATGESLISVKTQLAAHAKGFLADMDELGLTGSEKPGMKAGVVDGALYCYGGCGLRYILFPLDVLLPTPLWNRIAKGDPFIESPDDDESKEGRGGVLCAACIVKRLSKLPSVTVARLSVDELDAATPPQGAK